VRIGQINEEAQKASQYISSMYHRWTFQDGYRAGKISGINSGLDEAIAEIERRVSEYVLQDGTAVAIRIAELQYLQQHLTNLKMLQS
jgi:hypothetical protein